MILTPNLPPPDDTATARSRALSHLLRQQILQHGPMSFETYMEAALYHPLYGYYNSPDFAIGREGDFTTAPEISPLFAQCLTTAYLALNETIPSPAILEIGPGTGRFAYDFLLELETQRQLPAYYFLYEKNQRLQEKQQTLLATLPSTIHTRCLWLNELPVAFNGLILANEVLDALPVKRFKVVNHTGYEQCVIWNENQFSWKTQQNTLLNDIPLPDGYLSETCEALPAFLHPVAQSLQQGLILLIDYGYGADEYYHPERHRGTLTCFYQHHQHDSPLILTGLQDITAHVNFTRVAETGVASGCDLLGFTTQASFLLELGLINRAERIETTLNDRDAFHLHQAIKTLTLPTEMGERIKIMGLGKNLTRPVRGFATQCRIHTL